MIGANGVGILVIVILALYASAGIAILLFIAGVVLFFLKRKRASLISFALVLCLVSAWGAVYLWMRPAAPKDYTISFRVPSDWGFSELPGARVRNYSPNQTEYQTWGRLNIDIILPDGKRITGESRRIFVNTADSKIKNINLFYTPSQHGSIFDYWKDGGHVGRYSSETSITVDRGSYSLELFSTKDSGYRLEIQIPASRLSKIQG